MTTGKTIALTRRTSVGKVKSLLFNILSRLVITFLPRSKRLLISWLQSPSAVILEPPKIKSDTVSPSISHEVMGLDAMILVFKPFNITVIQAYAPTTILLKRNSTYFSPLQLQMAIMLYETHKCKWYPTSTKVWFLKAEVLIWKEKWKQLPKGIQVCNNTYKKLQK